MKKYTLAAFAAFLFLFLSACKQENAIDKEEFDYGTVVDSSVYINKYFDFSIEIPKGWDIQTADESKQLRQAGKEIVAGDDEQLKATIDHAEVTSANLVTVFKYDLTKKSDEAYNPNFFIMTENIKPFKNIKRGSNYLDESRKLLSKSKIPLEIEKNYGREKISGFDFDIMTVTVHYNGIQIVQEYYTTISGGYALTALFSYSTPEQKEQLMAVKQTIGNYRSKTRK